MRNLISCITSQIKKIPPSSSQEKKAGLIYGLFLSLPFVGFGLGALYSYLTKTNYEIPTVIGSSLGAIGTIVSAKFFEYFCKPNPKYFPEI